MKFTDKGWITLRGRSFSERGFVELKVQDTGIGIAPVKQPHLFEKFQQLDSTFTRQQGGSGLGLAICRSLVEMMDGRIKLWSAGVGCGTTVTFSLPVRREQEDAVHVKGKEALVAAGDESGVRVLVVDNDPEFRHYFKTLLGVGCQYERNEERNEYATTRDPSRRTSGRGIEGTQHERRLAGTPAAGSNQSHHPNLVLHRPDCSQAQQIVVRRDQRKVHDLSGGGQKPIRGITVRQWELLGEQHDFVCERRFPQRRRSCGQPFGQIVGEPNPALGIQQ